MSSHSELDAQVRLQSITTSTWSSWSNLLFRKVGKPWLRKKTMTSHLPRNSCRPGRATTRQLAVGWPTVGPRCPEKPVVHIKTYGIVNVRWCNNTLLKRKELENHKSNLSNEPSERGTGWNIRVLMFCRKQGCQKLVTKYFPISSAKDNR